MTATFRALASIMMGPRRGLLSRGTRARRGGGLVAGGERVLRNQRGGERGAQVSKAGASGVRCCRSR